MECAECSAPAALLVIHPRLFRMVVPTCGLHGELEPGADLDMYAIGTPEADEILATHTLLRGNYVPLR